MGRVMASAEGARQLSNGVLENRSPAGRMSARIHGLLADLQDMLREPELAAVVRMSTEGWPEHAMEIDMRTEGAVKSVTQMVTAIGRAGGVTQDT